MCVHLDPTIIFADEHEHYIWGDKHGDVRARVDAEDYGYFSRWAWHAVANSRGKKFYLKRTVEFGNRTTSLYLHVAIHERRQVEKPTTKHTMVDHLNGDSLECRRFNLEWATPSMNAKNRFGQARFRL